MSKVLVRMFTVSGVEKSMIEPRFLRDYEIVDQEKDPIHDGEGDIGVAIRRCDGQYVRFSSWLEDENGNVC